MQSPLVHYASAAGHGGSSVHDSTDISRRKGS
jgi:hypothetical protein